MQTSASDPLIPLAGGYACRTSVFIWILDASFRGIALRQDGDDLVARPRAAVTAADAVFMRQHKTELLKAIVYIDAMAARPL